MVAGSGGVFTVAVDGNVVAKKTLFGFPEEEEIVREVGKAIGETPA